MLWFRSLPESGGLRRIATRGGQTDNGGGRGGSMGQGIVVGAGVAWGETVVVMVPPAGQWEKAVGQGKGKSSVAPTELAWRRMEAAREL